MDESKAVEEAAAAEKVKEVKEEKVKEESK